MDVSEGLLVALMFITILTMAIGALLATLVDLVHVSSGATYSRLQVLWIGFLLLAILNMFWHTIDLLEVEDWDFVGFLFIISGAILAYLSASVLTTPIEAAEGVPEELSYLRVVNRFLLIFAALEFWVIGVDAVLGRGFTGAGAFSAALALMALGLSRAQSYRVHFVGVGAAWLIVLASAGLRGLGEIV